MSQINGPSFYLRTESRTQVERWRATAHRQGLPLSAWVRQELDAAAARGVTALSPYGLKHGPPIMVRTESKAQVGRWKAAAKQLNRPANDWARHVLDAAAASGRPT